MTLTSGTRFGPFEIVELIGVGGMGEVYRAADVNLGRDVAIKVLPKLLCTDPDRLARFTHEGRMLAALNHPNVAHIYGLEKLGDQHGFVMELVDGPTLAELIDKGPLPVEEAVSIGLQILAALAAAHARGIVHRDLKPANVKLNHDGTAKVLDFGIAKTVAPPEDGNAAATDPTALPMTQAGLIIGTPAYMSPEQARGAPVDERTDVWAFGCVLFEMLTGERMFADARLTTSRTLAHDDLAQIEALPESVPSSVRTTLRLCLQPDVDRRWADVRDVRLGLLGAVTEAPEGERRKPPRIRASALLLAAALALGVGGATLFAWDRLPAPERAPPVVRFTVPIGEVGANAGLLALSKDGRSIAFRATSTWDLQVRNIDDPLVKVLPGTTEYRPFMCFSPDGKWLAYAAESNTQLKRVALAGGAPLDIVANLEDVNGPCDWGDDRYVYFSTLTGLQRVPETGGALETVVAATPDMPYIRPILLPGGRALLATRGGASPEQRIIDLVEKTETTIRQAGGAAVFLPSRPGATRGYLLHLAAGSLFATPFDAERRTAGAAERVLDNVGNYTVSPNGTLAYISRTDLVAGGGSMLGWAARDGSYEPLPGSRATYGVSSLAPDGTRVAADVFDGSNVNLHVYEIASARLSRLTFGDINTTAVWTPDSRRLIYWTSERSPPTPGTSLSAMRELRAVPADGSGPPEALASFESVVGSWPPGPTSVSVDGRVVLGMRQVSTNGTGDLWELPLSGDAHTVASAPLSAVRPWLATPFNERGATFSPDGRFVAYSSNESGRDEIYVVSYPGPGGKWPVSTAGGIWPKWNPQGGELFYQHGSELFAVPVATSPTFRSGTPTLLFDAPTLLHYERAFSVAPDGQRFLVQKRDTSEGSLQVVVNWIEDVREHVPLAIP